MRRVWSAAILICVVVAGGLWLWRPSEEPAPGGVPAAASAAPSSGAPGAAEAHPSPIWHEPLISGPAGAPPELSAAAAAAPAERRPTFGSSPLRRVKRKQISELTERELEKFGTTIELYQRAQERHIGPLLYPPGHPKEGQYRDSVTLDQAVAAQLDYYEEVTPPGYLDRPQLHVRKRVPYRAISERQREWVQDDIASSRAFYEWLLEQPEDPRAFPGDFWFPADPSDPDAVTRREGLEQRIREQEAPLFED